MPSHQSSFVEMWSYLYHRMKAKSESEGKADKMNLLRLNSLCTVYDTICLPYGHDQYLYTCIIFSNIKTNDVPVINDL